MQIPLPPRALATDRPGVRRPPTRVTHDFSVDIHLKHVHFLLFSLETLGEIVGPLAKSTRCARKSWVSSQECVVGQQVGVDDRLHELLLERSFPWCRL